MEIHPGPNFNFGGRVHANGNLFMMSGSNLYFRSRVTAVGEVVIETWPRVVDHVARVDVIVTDEPQGVRTKPWLMKLLSV